MEKEFVISLHSNIINDKFHYPLLSYKVELFGSWNDWSIGHPAIMEYEMSRGTNNKWIRMPKYCTRIKLNKGKYEYKWKFIYKDIHNPLKNHVVWLIDGGTDIASNDNWNQNNIFEHR
jgi:hypothetical protein